MFGVLWTSPKLIEFNSNVAVMIGSQDNYDGVLQSIQEGKEWSITHEHGIDVLKDTVIEKAGGDDLPPDYVEAHSGETIINYIPSYVGLALIVAPILTAILS
jgi:hypothetical protein